jgi:hypothetical protein
VRRLHGHESIDQSSSAEGRLELVEGDERPHESMRGQEGTQSSLVAVLSKAQEERSGREECESDEKSEESDVQETGDGDDESESKTEADLISSVDEVACVSLSVVSDEEDPFQSHCGIVVDHRREGEGRGSKDHSLGTFEEKTLSPQEEETSVGEGDAERGQGVVRDIKEETDRERQGEARERGERKRQRSRETDRESSGASTSCLRSISSSSSSSRARALTFALSSSKSQVLRWY